uniref:Divalent cation transporter n=1 Tax=Ascaris lumbricoides TaxID=6252 RepID=A0A0M3HWV4_ASCLU
MVGAGLLLDHAASWSLFESTPETFILVPALLGLKGNLEMTLASRLSTMSNMGLMSTSTEQLKVACVNLALTQAQAVIVSFVAAVFTVAVSVIQTGQAHYSTAALLAASSMVTATVASFILGLVMIIVIIVSVKLSVNPDNIATPIAASLGDLTTLALLTLIGTVFHSMKGTHNEWVLTAVYVLLLVVTPFWIYLSSKDESTLVVLKYGWWPVICAMVISSGGGFILKVAMARYPEIAVFQPVVNGVGGNLVAVQASRISTSLYQAAKIGSLPNGPLFRFISPLRAFFSSENDSVAARILLLMSIPGHLIFVTTIILIGGISFSVYFIVAYLIAAVAQHIFQVCILLFLCQYLIRLMWSCKVDPDSSAIPLLSSIGDLLGRYFAIST